MSWDMPYSSTFKGVAMFSQYRAYDVAQEMYARDAYGRCGHYDNINEAFAALLSEHGYRLRVGDLTFRRVDNDEFGGKGKLCVELPGHHVVFEFDKEQLLDLESKFEAETDPADEEYERTADV